ncbi:MAG: hypothetical protein KGJ58_03850 [Patescibacteria group bacterium]|nr:hypothetical protein [Patescibacteria group bacterium]MDE1988228.1 hypothetical protein [Patescibacteria group bacterium]MDE2218557.1 hypothetical protein [Patescibacteria group bacterium]
MTTQSITSITDGQRKWYERFVEDAADKALAEAGLDKDGIQKLIENGDEFQARIIAGIKELSVSNQFADEEVQSSYAYPKGYKVKRITEQTNILRQLFPGIGNALEKIAEWPLPPYAEGWFAIPKWQTMAASYGEAVEKVLAMIESKRSFYNYRDDQLGAEYLRQHAKTAKMFQKLGDEQKDHDILVVPAQFGLRHKGRSVRRAREVFQANEFGLGAFAIGIMLLTHPEREVQWEQLHVDCAGDEFAPDADGYFSYAPVFHFVDGDVEFDAFWFDAAFASYGSASAFLSQ